MVWRSLILEFFRTLLERKQMRVLLINPLSGWFSVGAMSMPPLGLLMIATKLKQNGHEVIFIDRNARLFGQKINGVLIGRADAEHISALDRTTRDEIRLFQPDLVGLTVMTTQLRDANHVATMIRRTCGEDTLIVAGGYHPSSEPLSIFRDIPALDIAVRGQGEFIMADLAAGRPVAEIEGVSYRPARERRSVIKKLLSSFFEKKIVFQPDSILRTLDAPWSKDRILTVRPARDLIDANYYQREGCDVINYYYFRRPASIVSSRGCPKHCSFCASVEMENKMFFSPVENLLDQIEDMVEKDGVTGLFFYDINFPVHRKRTREFCSQMVQRGLADRIKWLACASADNLPYELLPEMRRAGCIGMVFGFESASQRMLDIFNKKTDVRMNQKAVDACKCNDIRPQSGFIVGAPGETEYDIQVSLEFIAKNDLMSSLNILLPLPGTQINAQVQRMGRLDPNHPDYWGLVSDTNAPLLPSRIYNDIPFEKFLKIYNDGTRDVCAPTWKTIQVDPPSHLAKSEPGMKTAS